MPSTIHSRSVVLMRVGGIKDIRVY
ncbi:hypothetical protein Ocin01_19505 [Orchesella cincta]|uniref:Uncharacterized protein n=1 Tax=Orchesella cincta TaxID=48709 RepID=A0A1D2M2I2_ORCCI|nr:hypothetical protein Ocin01_19505 [Orchesella cincta]